MRPPTPDLHELTGPWLGSQPKIQLLAFFRENPGVIETVDGLARRLGVRREKLEPAIRDHVELGILRERDTDDRVVVLYDRRKDTQVQQALIDALEERRGRRDEGTQASPADAEGDG